MSRGIQHFEPFCNNFNKNLIKYVDVVAPVISGDDDDMVTSSHSAFNILIRVVLLPFCEFAFSAFIQLI